MIWTGRTAAWTVALLLVAGTLAHRSRQVRLTESHVEAPTTPTPPEPSIAVSMPPSPVETSQRPMAKLVEPIASWDVHAYRPDRDGNTWLDLGNMLETPVLVRSGDRLKLKASFREPVYAVALAINPDGSVQRLGVPANADTEEMVTELSSPPGVDRYIRLTDPGPTALFAPGVAPAAFGPHRDRHPRLRRRSLAYQPCGEVLDLRRPSHRPGLEDKVGRRDGRHRSVRGDLRGAQGEPGPGRPARSSSRPYQPRASNLSNSLRIT